MAEQKQSPWDEMVDGIFSRAEARMADLERERNETHAGTHETPYLGYGQNSRTKTGNREYIDRHYDQKIEEVRKDAFNNAIDSSRHADKDTQAAIRVRADNWRSDKPAEDISKPKDMDDSARIFNKQRNQSAQEKEHGKTENNKSDYNVNVKVEFETKEKQQKEQREQLFKDQAENKSDMFSRQQDRQKPEPEKENEASKKEEPDKKEQPNADYKQKDQPDKAEPDTKTQELRSQFAHQRWEMLSKEEIQENDKPDKEQDKETDKDEKPSSYNRWKDIDKEDDKTKESSDHEEMEPAFDEKENNDYDDYDED